MKTVELDQRSEAWARWRAEGITATDASVILGLNPRKSAYALWCEKTGRVAVENLSRVPAVQYGIVHEPVARALYEEQRREVVTPVCAECDIDNRFRASFDGIDIDGNPVEFKCPLPGGTSLADVVEHGSDGEQYRKYYPQVQHQLLVSGASVGHLVFYEDRPIGEGGARLHIFEVRRNEAMIEEILAQGKAFLACLEKDEPPERRAGDIYVPKGEDAIDWVRAATQLASIEPKLEALEARRNAIHETVKRIMGSETNACFKGLAVTVTQAKGSVDYREALYALLGRELTKEELERFRKPAGSPRWSIRLTGKSAFTEKALAEQELEYESVRDSNSETFTAVGGLVL